MTEKKGKRGDGKALRCTDKVIEILSKRDKDELMNNPSYRSDLRQLNLDKINIKFSKVLFYLKTFIYFCLFDYTHTVVVIRNFILIIDMQQLKTLKIIFYEAIKTILFTFSYGVLGLPCSCMEPGKHFSW